MKKLGLILILIILSSCIPVYAAQDNIKHLDKQNGSVELTKEKTDKTIKIKLISTETPTFMEDGKKQKHIYGTITTETYLITDGLEYMIILNEPQPTNVFSMTVEDEGLKWFYQPPLTEEYQYANETHAWNSEGTILAYRPENIVESYAIYDGDIKFSHVYRPLVYDSDGSEIWGKLDYTNGVLSVTVDQKWLDKADYPVYVDPTFGYTTVGASTENLVVDTIVFSWWTYSNPNSVINNITAYLTQQQTDDIKLAIYNDNGTSKNLVVESEIWTKNADGWHTFNIPTTAYLSNGTYALAVWSDEPGGTHPGLRYDIGGGDSGKDVTVGAGNWSNFPATLTESSADTRKYSVYVNYTVIAPTPPVNVALDSDAVFSKDVYGWVNATVYDENLVNNLNTVTIQVNTTGDSENFTLRWTQTTNTFTEVSDPSGICTLGASVRTNFNATTDIISFNFTITGGQSGLTDVRLTTIDDGALSDIDLYTSEFDFSYFNWNTEVYGLINSLFGDFGIIGYMTLITTYIAGFTTWFSSSLTRLLALMVQQFRIINAVYTFFTYWFTAIVGIVLDFSTYYQSILDGTYAISTGLGNIWNLTGYNSWAPIIPLALFLWWIDSFPKRAAQTVGGETQVFINDISTAINLVSYFTGIFMFVANTVIDRVLGLLGAKA